MELAPAHCSNCGEPKGACEPYAHYRYCARCGRDTLHLTNEPDKATKCQGCGKALTLAQAYFDTVSGKVECQSCAGVDLSA